MSMVNSPKPDYDPRGAQERHTTRVVVIRAATIVCLLVSVLLGVYLWIAGDVVNLAFGRTGAVRGTVVNEAGEPLAHSEVFLIAAPDAFAYTDQNGRFSLDNAPTGAHSLIVSVGAWGQEYPVTVQGRTITDVGTLTYLTPPLED